MREQQIQSAEDSYRRGSQLSTATFADITRSLVQGWRVAQARDDGECGRG